LTVICSVVFNKANYFYGTKEKGRTKQLPVFSPKQSRNQDKF